ncbi:MAG: metal-dependent hydrolase [Candidatus Acidiferrales bacterium]
MDPITHGLTGALIGKAFFAGALSQRNPRRAELDEARGELSPEHTSSRTGVSRAAIWISVLAALFPDIDILFDPFVPNEMFTIELHRGVTHSLVCLPAFSIALATATWWWLKWRTRRKLRNSGQAAESRFSWRMLTAIWAAGMASHILLDLATSWGTMVWAPLSNTRVAWDLVFIIDFTLTAIVVAPQVLAWIYRRRQGARRQAVAMWVIFSLCALGAGALLRGFGLPLSPWAIPMAVIILGLVFFAPMLRGRGFALSRAAWCRCGVLALAGYYALCALAHQRALSSVRGFATARGLQAEAIGALPMPPSHAYWQGLIRTPDGAYRSYFAAGHNPGPHFEFIADQKLPAHVAQALDAQPEVRIWRWFARFPVIRHRQQDGEHIVDLLDLRFFAPNRGATVAFQYRVVVSAQGEVVRQGWADALTEESGK